MKKIMGVVGVVVAVLFCAGMAPAYDYVWTGPTGSNIWESANWSTTNAAVYPDGAGISVYLATNSTVWTMTNATITVGQMICSNIGGYNVTGTTLVFDNGAGNAVFQRGNVGTTSGMNLKFTTITLNSSLDINITSHVTSGLTIAGALGGIGALNIYYAPGDTGWNGVTISGTNTYSGGTTLNSGVLTLNQGKIAGDIAMSSDGNGAHGYGGHAVFRFYSPGLASQSTVAISYCNTSNPCAQTCKLF